MHRVQQRHRDRKYDRIRDIEDTVRQFHIHLNEYPEGENRKNGGKVVFNYMMVEYIYCIGEFSRILKEMTLQFEEL